MNTPPKQQIHQFTINTRDGNLSIMSTINKPINLSFEYLRVFAPAECKKAQGDKTPHKSPQVFHKKNIKLSAIEPLGKHGYRFIFDDDFSDIFSDDDLFNLHQQHTQLWPLYEASLSSVNSREESINFKPVT